MDLRGPDPLDLLDDVLDALSDIEVDQDSSKVCHDSDSLFEEVDQQDSLKELANEDEADLWANVDDVLDAFWDAELEKHDLIPERDGWQDRFPAGTEQDLSHLSHFQLTSDIGDNTQRWWTEPALEVITAQVGTTGLAALHRGLLLYGSDCSGADSPKFALDAIAMEPEPQHNSQAFCASWFWDPSRLQRQGLAFVSIGCMFASEHPQNKDAIAWLQWNVKPKHILLDCVVWSLGFGL
jgi:hypothetical protein